MVNFFDKHTHVDDDILIGALEHAYEWFNKGGDGTRFGTIYALASAVRYLNDNLLDGDRVRLLKPLQCLLADLERLNIGIDSRVLKPAKKRRGATPLHQSEADMQILCCAVFELLRREGKTVAGASELVAARLTELSIYKQRKNRSGDWQAITGKTVRGWLKDRDRLLQSSSWDCSQTLEDWIQDYFVNFWTPSGATKRSTDPSPTADSAALLILDTLIPVAFGHLRVRDQE